MVTFTVDELRNFSPAKLHDTPKVRSIDWALDEKCMDERDGPNTVNWFIKYKVALEKLILPGKVARGKGGVGCVAREVQLFKGVLARVPLE